MRLIPKTNTTEIAGLILRGASLVFPTETSYGLGGDATVQAVADRVFKIKERSDGKPLLIVVPDVKSAKKYLVWNGAIEKLAARYWPGPLTVIGKYSGAGNLARGVVAKNGTVAVRVTADPWLRNLCYEIGRPLIATSANISGGKNIYDSREIFDIFKNRTGAPEAVVDAGALPANPPTAIVDASKNKIKIIRQGMVKIEEEKTGSGFIRKIILAGAAIASAIIISYFWKIALIDIENNTRLISYSRRVFFIYGVKNPLLKVKGVYLTAYSAGNPKKIDEIINLIEKTELNAVVIDIKDYSGLILYDSDISTVNQLKTEDDRLGDVAALVKKLHEHNIYTIARQTVFQDPALAEKKPEWAIKNKSGGVWRDRKGLSWVDPTRREVWAYNIAIAKEAVKFGFDEINFDYVRFPSDGNMSEVVYTVGDKKKYEVMSEFYRTLGNRLASEPVWISLDMFGFVMEKSGEDDMNIGQRLSDAVDNADFVCPMMYPSHYPAGHLGFANPAEHPAEVFENGMKMGLPQFDGHRAKLRPWIQAFNLGAVYGADKIRAQIAVVEKNTNAGWLLWNASNRYTAEGLN